MNRLKNLRTENNIKQTKIAKLLNIKQNSYSQYENESRDLPTSVLKILANYYKVSIDYILNLTDIKSNYSKSKIISINSNMNRFKEIREDQDLLQKDIAKLLNISQNTYSLYENGESDISPKNLIKLSLFYNVPIDYLLYTTDERIPHKRIKKNNN